MALSIPTDWTYNVDPAPAVLASIVVPAAPGITHVLTHLFAKLINSQQAAAVGETVRVIDGTTTIWSLGMIVDGAGANIIKTETFDSDLLLMGTPGNALTINFVAAPPVGYYEQLIIQGHSF